MSRLDIIRAWKDEEYLSRLTDGDRTQLPEHPAGLIELTHAEMNAVAGGMMQLRTMAINEFCKYL